MPFGIRPSNVRVCHSTTRASRGSKLSADGSGWQVSNVFFLLLLVLVFVIVIATTTVKFRSTSMSTSMKGENNWIKIDLHIHTRDDPKDAVDFSAHELLEKARSLGFRVLAITLHDAVFDRQEVFADTAAMGILLIPAVEVRLLGADVIVLNVTPGEMAQVKNFDDLRQLRARRGKSIFTIAPHPFYIFGGSIGSRLFKEIDCFDAIEICHFHIGPLNPNWRARRVAIRFGKPMIATSDAHRLHAFGRHYTSMPMPSALTIENVLAGLRSGPLRLTSPASSVRDFVSAVHFVFLAHPFRVRRKLANPRAGERRQTVPPQC